MNATKEAKNASEEALKAAEESNKLIDGLDEKSSEAENASMTMLDEAKDLYQTEKELEPVLLESGNHIAKIRELTNQNEAGMKKINDSLNRLGDKDFGESSEHAIFISDLGKRQSKEALDKIGAIAQNTKQDLEHAKQLPKDIDDTARDLNYAHTQLDQINTIMPNITNLIDELGPQQTTLHDSVDGIEDKIKQLQRKIEEARKTANR